MDNNVFNETESGTGQGSIISLLLANIALLGMEEVLSIRYRAQNRNGKYAGHTNETAYSSAFYADNFVAACKTREDAESIYGKLKPCLEIRRLELLEEKTRMVNIREGFDFPGFNIRMFPTWYGEIMLTRPSKETMKKSKVKIKGIFQKCNGRNVNELIQMLNPVITGLAGYWLPFNSKQAFRETDDYIWYKTGQFLKRAHHNKCWKWIRRKYYSTDKTGQSRSTWILTAPDTKNQLKRMAWIPIIRHPLIKHRAIPYNRELAEYFRKRKERQFRRNTVGSRQKLAGIQKYCCTLCHQSITDFPEKLTVQQKIPEKYGGDYSYRNLELVHNICGRYWKQWIARQKELPS